MRTWTTRSFISPIALSFAMIAPFILAAHASDEAARALADRFAGGPSSQNQSQATDPRHAEEAEILERARSEAVELQERANTMKPAEAAKIAVEEKHKLEVQQRAIVERRADEAQAAAVQAKLEAENAARLAAEATAAQADRAKEVSDLAERLRRVRETRPAGAMGLGGPLDDTPPTEAPNDNQLEATPEAAQQPAAAGNAVVTFESGTRHPGLPQEAVRNATSVTVLLVLEPGSSGIRFGNKTADPVICLDQWCYVSNGPNVPAKLMSRGGALGPVNTLGLRAGACRQSLTCVFRGLDIAAYFKAGARQPNLQPIDLRYLHHDRRQAKPLKVDAGCTLVERQVNCATAIKGKNWTAWIVPENLAVEAGVEALQAALEAGLAPGTSKVKSASLRGER